jgi:prepilin-type N-terminal cleavage/methylation domain-containing protein
MRGRIQSVGAFTLIELLIVVAIIGVLAAIAVPNYQQALTKSKVARFQGDCKASELAIEAYNSDMGTYPWADGYPVPSTCDPWYGNPPSFAQGYLPRRLTTPVAYLNKMPMDIFRDMSDVGSCLPDRRTYLYSSDSQNPYIYGGQFSVSWTYAYVKGDTNMQGPRPSTAVWMIFSCGPDTIRDMGPGGASAPGMARNNTPTCYDPTNGTISQGDLFMFGPGLGFGVGH